MAAYQQALSGTPAVISNRIKPGTVDALVHHYLRSAPFQSLAAETQRSRRNILMNFAREYGDEPVAKLRREHVIAMFNKKADRSHRQQHSATSLPTGATLPV